MEVYDQIRSVDLILRFVFALITSMHWRQFWEGRGGRHPLGSDTEGGERCLAPSVFWLVIPTWKQVIQNSGLR